MMTNCCKKVKIIRIIFRKQIQQQLQVLVKVDYVLKDLVTVVMIITRSMNKIIIKMKNLMNLN